MSAPIKTALEISNIYHDPINLADSQCMSNFYNNHPILSRFIFIPIGFVSGLIKPVTFVISALVASVVMPIIGAIKGYRGQSELACNYIKAGALNLLGAVVTLTFFVVSAYYLPLAASASIYIGATVACIVVHVYRASNDRPTVIAPPGGVLVDPSNDPNASTKWWSCFVPSCCTK